MIMAIPMEDWLRGCIYHDGRHGYVTLPCDEVLKIADFIESLRADRKTEPQKKEVEWVYNKRERLWYPYSNGELLFKDEPITQTETQNSNLTFEKRTMRDCYNCKRYDTEDECIECRYEPKDEPMKTADYCDICKRDMCEDCIADATNPYCVPSHYEINYEPKDEPQTCSVNGRLYSECGRCEFFKCMADEPQTDGILFKGNLKEGDYKLIKTTDGWVLEGESIVYCGWERRNK